MKNGEKFGVAFAKSEQAFVVKHRTRFHNEATIVKFREVTDDDIEFGFIQVRRIGGKPKKTP